MTAVGTDRPRDLSVVNGKFHHSVLDCGGRALGHPLAERHGPIRPPLPRSPLVGAAGTTPGGVGVPYSPRPWRPADSWTRASAGRPHGDRSASERTSTCTGSKPFRVPRHPRRLVATAEASPARGKMCAGVTPAQPHDGPDVARLIACASSLGVNAIQASLPCPVDPPRGNPPSLLAWALEDQAQAIRVLLRADALEPPIELGKERRGDTKGLPTSGGGEV